MRGDAAVVFEVAPVEELAFGGVGELFGDAELVAELAGEPADGFLLGLWEGGEVFEAAVAFADVPGRFRQLTVAVPIAVWPGVELTMRTQLESSPIDDFDADGALILAEGGVVGGGNAEVGGPLGGIEDFEDAPVEVDEVGGGDALRRREPALVSAGDGAAGSEMEHDQVLGLRFGPELIRRQAPAAIDDKRHTNLQIRVWRDVKRFLRVSTGKSIRINWITFILSRDRLKER